MLLVLNEGNDPNTNGFADANSSGLHRALIMRPTCAGRVTETLPDYHRTWAMEFRYDGARQRYLTRRLDPDTLVALGSGDDQWTTYLGDEPVDDYHYDSSQYTWPVDRQYLFGVAEWHADADTTGYLHGDLIGSTVAVTSDDQSPAVVRRVVYTAFGEAISVAGPDGNPTAAPFATRYGYAGAFGYQEHDVGSCGLIGTNSLPPAEGCTQTAWSPDGLPDSLLNASPLAGFRFQHLGHRYYDPSTGRFIQRDPIGLAGGFNVYEYAMSRPVASVDPTGTEVMDGWIHDWERGFPPKQPPVPLAPLFWSGVDAANKGWDWFLGWPLGCSSTASNVGTIANFKYRFGIGRLMNLTTAVTTGAIIGGWIGKVVVAVAGPPISDGIMWIAYPGGTSGGKGGASGGGGPTPEPHIPCGPHY